MYLTQPYLASAILGLVLLTPLFAEAQFDFTDIAVDADTRLQVDGDSVEIISGDTRISTDGNTSQISDGDSTIETNTQTGTRIETPSTRIQTNDTTTSIETRPSTSNTIQQDATIEARSLNQQALSVRISVGDAPTAANINLEQDGETLIQTEEDVQVFASIVSDRPGVERVSVTSDAVTVEYVDRGRLLGILPMSYTARATVDAEGSVRVSRPWYGFLLFGTKRSEIIASTQRSLGTRTPSADVVVRAQTIDIVTDSVSMHVGGSVSLTTDDASLRVNEDGSVEMNVR